MTSCTIIISHFESLPFLHACIRQIRKYKREDIDQNIIICDQSKEETTIKIFEEYGSDFDIKIVKTDALYSGYGIDYIMRNVDIQTEYVCEFHVDAFPIHKNWLSLCIKLIEEYNLSHVGQLHLYSLPNDTIYPPDPFFSMSPTFNVARTETYKEMSLGGGFTRFHNRPHTGMTWIDNDWAEWAKEDYSARGSDDDVPAYHWQDKHRQHNKLGLAITGFVAPQYGRIIEDIVFHFGSCRESVGVIDSMPEMYKEFTKRINENYSDELIEEMISLAKPNKPPEIWVLVRNFWDGELKKSSPPSESLNKRIEELKKA